MGKLDELGFNTDVCTVRRGSGSQSGSKVDFRLEGPLKLDIHPETADIAVESFGEYVDYGISDSFEIAICEGLNRKLSRASAGRRHVNISKARDNLLSLVPKGIRLESVYFEEPECIDGVMVFKPDHFCYRDGTGFHCCDADTMLKR